MFTVETERWTERTDTEEMCSTRENQVNSKYFKKLKIEEGRGGRRKEKVRHSQSRTNFTEKK